MQDFDAIPPLFELVAETQDSVAIPLPFETVSETQDSDAEVDAVTDALSQLPPQSQEPLTPPTYRIKKMTKEINSSMICKLTRICRLPLLVEEVKKVCVVMKQVQLEGWHLAKLHVLRCRSATEKDNDGILTGKTVKVGTEWGDTDDPIEQELHEWLGIVPWQWQIRANCAHFLYKLYDMLAWMKEVVDKHPKTKGARLYSLLPVATTFQAAYVKLNASTLHGLLARLIDLPEVENFLKKELNIVLARNRTELQLTFDKKTFQKNRSEVIRKVFDVEQFETRNCKFADTIKTNGYGALITMIRPVTTTSVVVVEKKASRKKRKKNDGTAELVWSRRTGIKGHASGPVKGFAEALKRQAAIIPMDEYRTSIMCSCCHQRLK
ncbi:hypothetical protein BBJ29_007958 [Phytophthora kernoviae]|uniref:Uncharacterized protein n=1 Tax=Phytophthora kernoviae TaxID=325452 RepID=A0A3R7K1L6_9STRA|nr:hypothetical protein BBJ29_007958 [Phytophthora kernoviae]